MQRCRASIVGDLIRSCAIVASATSWSQGAFISQGGMTVSAVGDAFVAVGAVGNEAFRWLPSTGIVGLGDLPGGALNSQAHAVSPDGSVVVGYSSSASGTEAFRWTQDDGMVGLGDLAGGVFYSAANAVSDDGLVVVGTSHSNTGGYEAFRWTVIGGSMLRLGILPGGGFSSAATDVSSDGSVVVGLAMSSMGVNNAFRWTQATGMVPLSENTSTYSKAQFVSDDGSVIAGRQFSNGAYRVFRWTAAMGMVNIDEASGLANQANWMSSDGSIIVGTSSTALENEAFRWTEGSGIEGLGDLPGGGFHSEAWGASADGSIVVGYSHGAVRGYEAVIWDPVNGLRSIQTTLGNDFGAELTGWTLQNAIAVSADGRTVIGYGDYFGAFRGWIATIPLGLPGDADGDNDVDFQDFMLLQVGYGITSDAAQSDGDLDMDGDVDFQDFLILQSHYATSADVIMGAGVAAAVPEPSTLALALLGCVTLALHCYSKRMRLWQRDAFSLRLLG